MLVLVDQSLRMWFANNSIFISGHGSIKDDRSLCYNINTSGGGGLIEGDRSLFYNINNIPAVVMDGSTTMDWSTVTLGYSIVLLILIVMDRSVCCHYAACACSRTSNDVIYLGMACTPREHS